MCVCVYVRVCLYACMSMRSFIHHTSACACVFVTVCANIRIYIYMHVCMQLYTDLKVHICKYVLCVYIVCICIHVYIYIYIAYNILTCNTLQNIQVTQIKYGLCCITKYTSI